MIIRHLRPSDHPKLRELHEKSPSKYELPDFEGRNFPTGFVAVDENDEPRVLLCFRRTAEAYVVVDHEYDVPAYRLVALGELIQAAKPVMGQLGYDDVFGTIGPDVPKGYWKRLVRFGCELFPEWTVVKFWKER